MILLKQSKTSGIAVRLFLYIPVVWAALLIAQSLGGGLPDIIGKLTAALENPFSVHWTKYSALSILLCTAAYILALLYRSANQGRTRDGEEHGSATWASPREVNAQFSQKENKLLTRNVRLGLVNNLIQATTPENSHNSDPFWEKSETALLQAIILML